MHFIRQLSSCLSVAWPFPFPGWLKLCVIISRVIALFLAFVWACSCFLSLVKRMDTVNFFSSFELNRYLLLKLLMGGA